MKVNLKFEYLHRDEGNYKIFGSEVFSNPEEVSPEEATEMVKELIIDQQYFYPEEAKIQPFQEHNSIGIYFSDWYEFLNISKTHEYPTDKRSIQEFIKELEKNKS